MTDLSPPRGGPPHPGDPDEDGAAAVTSLPQDANGAQRLSVAAWLGRCWLAAVGLVIAVAANWRPGTLPLGRAGQRLELQVPGWLLIALVIAVVAVWLSIVSLLIRPPRRKDPDEIILEPPPPPRLSPVTLLLLGLLLVIAAGGAVLVLQLLDVYHGGGTVAHPVGIGAPPQAVQPAPLRGAARAATLDWASRSRLAPSRWRSSAVWSWSSPAMNRGRCSRNGSALAGSEKWSWPGHWPPPCRRAFTILMRGTIPGALSSRATAAAKRRWRCTAAGAVLRRHRGSSWLTHWPRYMYRRRRSGRCSWSSSGPDSAIFPSRRGTATWRATHSTISALP